MNRYIKFSLFILFFALYATDIFVSQYNLRTTSIIEPDDNFEPILFSIEIPKEPKELVDYRKIYNEFLESDQLIEKDEKSRGESAYGTERRGNLSLEEREKLLGEFANAVERLEKSYPDFYKKTALPTLNTFGKMLAVLKLPTKEARVDAFVEIGNILIDENPENLSLPGLIEKLSFILQEKNNEKEEEAKLKESVHSSSNASSSSSSI
jgi:hypothetical protein